MNYQFVTIKTNVIEFSNGVEHQLNPDGTHTVKVDKLQIWSDTPGFAELKAKLEAAKKPAAK